MDERETRVFEIEVGIASAFSPIGTPLDDIIRKALWQTLFRDEAITDELRARAREVLADPRTPAPGSGLASVDATLAHMIDQS